MQMVLFYKNRCIPLSGKILMAHGIKATFESSKLKSKEQSNLK